MPLPERLAFVDVETTGLAPRADRITEIGVVSLDASGMRSWSTLVNPGRSRALRSRLLTGVAPEALEAAPRFAAVAEGLLKRIKGRLLVAHNARFDHGFLHAEFERCGRDFRAPVLCTAMLSRRLFPGEARHDLDAIALRHGLDAGERHRALPDAQLLAQFWQALQGVQGLEEAIRLLLAEPVLPAALDPGLVDRLPATPGVFALLGGEGEVLHLAKAANLRLGVRDYFRMDRASAKALAAAHRVRDIRWQTASGALGAQFRLKAMSDALLPAKRRGAAFYAWRLRPRAVPCLELARLGAPPARDNAGRGADESLHGLFETERKARNALAKVAREHALCHLLLGMDGDAAVRPDCAACAAYGSAAAAAGAPRSPCQGKRERLRHLTRIGLALRAWRVPAWPYAGPIGVRERAELHVLDDWRYLGTARGAHEVGDLLGQRCGRGEGFERDIFAFLVKILARLPRSRVVPLAAAAINEDAVRHEEGAS